MATVLDTRKLAKRLKEAGVPDGQADAIIETVLEVRDTDLRQLATKADVESLRTATKADLAMAEARLEGKIDATYWKTLAGVAVLLLAHLAAVWGIVAAVAGKGH